MYRGETTFQCRKCGEEFIGPDIELWCTSLSQPLKCPHCGSMHTRPKSEWRKDETTDDDMYENAWKEFDKDNPRENPCFIPLAKLGDGKKEKKEATWWDIILMALYLPIAMFQDQPLWLKILLTLLFAGIIAFIIF